MNFIRATRQHLKQLMTWFDNQSEVYQWGGPEFRFPFSIESFYIDCKLDELNSYVLLDDDNSVIAFGQFYERLGCCHLGRLVVSPCYRGKGYGQVLINNLIEYGCKQLNTTELSLFVLSNNKSALRIYKLMGFVTSEYPEIMPIDDCLYMRKKLKK